MNSPEKIRGPIKVPEGLKKWGLPIGLTIGIIGTEVANLLMKRNNDDVQAAVRAELEHQEGASINEKIAQLPDTIMGAKVDKFIIEGAERVFIHIRQVHDDGIAENGMHPEAAAAQEEIAGILEVLIQHFDTRTVYTEGMTQERKEKFDLEMGKMHEEQSQARMADMALTMLDAKLEEIKRTQGESSDEYVFANGKIESVRLINETARKITTRRDADFFRRKGGPGQLALEGKIDLPVTEDFVDWESMGFKDVFTEDELREALRNAIKDPELSKIIFQEREQATMRNITGNGDKAVILVFGAAHNFLDDVLESDETFSVVEITPQATLQVYQVINGEEEEEGSDDLYGIVTDHALKVADDVLPSIFSDEVQNNYAEREQNMQLRAEHFLKGAQEDYERLLAFANATSDEEKKEIGNMFRLTEEVNVSVKLAKDFGADTSDLEEKLSDLLNVVWEPFIETRLNELAEKLDESAVNITFEFTKGHVEKANSYGVDTTEAMERLREYAPTVYRNELEEKLEILEKYIKRFEAGSNARVSHYEVKEIERILEKGEEMGVDFSDMQERVKNVSQKGLIASIEYRLERLRKEIAMSDDNPLKRVDEEIRSAKETMDAAREKSIDVSKYEAELEEILKDQ